MKKYLVFLIVFYCISVSKAQRHEIGFMFGQPNLISDIGIANYLQPIPDSMNPDFFPYSLGLLYRFNINPQMGFRLNFSFIHVNFDDDKTKEDYRVRRDFYGNNNIWEGSLFFEYNFFDINDEQIYTSSPYIFAGFGAFMANDRLYRFEHKLFTDAAGNPVTPSNTTDFQTDVYYDEEIKSGLSIPFGIGYKFKFNYNWVVSIEAGVRFTNTDRLDYSVSTPENYQDEKRYIAPELDSSFYDEILLRETNFKASRVTGNLTSNDWYVVSGISLSYAFGRPPCFCN